ncbi:MAG TPA: DUF2079 domain-containing protein [Chloroflexota bacterium]|nr:DUF2079 domain-containing protein [Chloroflexota bacterium]
MARRHGPRPDPSRIPWVILIALIAAYAAYFSVLSIRERDALYQFDEDLAIYDQIIWNTAHGHWFVSTLIQHANNMLGDHFSPGVAVFAPFYVVWPNPAVLLIGQSLLLALAAVPLYAFARQHLGSIAALLVAAAYLVYPALHFVNLFQFHEIALLPLPLAFALIAVENGSPRLFFAAALVSLTVKEEVAIVVVGLGLLWWLRRRDWRMGAATIALGLIVGAITMGVILPHFNLAGSGYYYVRRYAYLGDSPPRMIVTALTSPGLILAHLTTPDRLPFLAELFGPLLLTPLLGWEYVVAALPVFGYLLLGDSPDQYAIDRHYLTPLLPFLFFGGALGLARIRRGLGAVAERGPTAITLAGILLAASATASYLIGPTPFARGYDPRAFTATAHAAQIRRLMREIPAGASVSASRNLLSWFSERGHVYRFPQLGDAEYVLLDWRELRYPAVFSQDDDALGHLLSSPNYRMIDSAGATTLFQRGDPSAWSDTARTPTRFGDLIDLLDARSQTTQGGTAVEVTLYWRALKRPSKQYTVFVHVLTDQGTLLGQGDSWPLDNLYPTDMWPPGHVIPDTHTVALRQPVSSGGFHVEVGLYDLKTGARLPITARGLPGGVDEVDLAG